MPGRLESRPLRVSQRSNALQFYHHSLQSSSDKNNITSRPYYLYADTQQLVESPAKKQYGQQSGSGNQAPSRHRTISSLVTPFITAQSGKNSRGSGSLKKHDRGTASGGVCGDRVRLAPSSASIRSISSSILSRKRKYSAPPALDTLPPELLCEVFSYLNQETLHALLFVSRRIGEEAVYSLYEQPRFSTTYRFAQFVTTVTHNRHLARMVRMLDVSNLAQTEEDTGANGSVNRRGAKGEKRALAGWREWKFRSDPLHTIHRDDIAVGPSKRGSGAFKRRLKHPLPSPFLQRYADQRDLPIGAVVHIVVACPFLRKIDLSDIPLSDDYSVTSLGSHRTAYKPTTFTSLLFVSDVPKSYTWRDGDTRQISATSDLVDAITGLQYLKEIRLRRGLWLTRGAADRLVRGVKKLERVDFRECGMHRGYGWAVEAGKDEIKRILDAERNTDEGR